MGDKADDAADVRPPGAGAITVASMTGGTATAAVAHGCSPGQYLSIGVDNGSTSAASMPIWWVIFGTSAVLAPDPTNVTTAAMCMGPYQGISHHKVPAGAAHTHYRLIASGSGTLYRRHYCSSQGG